MSSEDQQSANGVKSSGKDAPEASVNQAQQPQKQDTPKKPTSKAKSTPAVTTDTNDAGSSGQLSGAALKKQKAAEKAARRAEKVALKGTEAPAPAQPNPQPVQHARRPSQGAKEPDKQSLTPSKHQRKPSNQPEPGVVRIPIRPQQPQEPTPSPKPLAKKVPFVAHLYPTASRASLTSASRDIHPQVLQTALFTRSFELVGGRARTIALLLAMKAVVKDYTAPPNVALSWHLVQVIGRQIGFLSTARPNGIAQGNAIRWLKQMISAVDVALDETAAKKYVCDEIDNYLYVKYLLAAQVIATEASKRIADDETILVYGKSSIVEQTLLKAAETKSFTVVVVDSRPLFEGKNLARGLVKAGMRREGNLSKCSVVYADISGLADVFEQHSVSKCFLGASGMLGNGSLYSRAGTATVAMMAKANHVPVIVLSETEKFTSRMVADSLVLNEIGDTDIIVGKVEKRQITTEVEKPTEDTKKGKKKPEEEKKKDDDPKELLEGWEDQQNLYLLNLLYDLTPKDFLDLVICEMGTLPPAAVPVVKRDSAEDLPQ